MVELKKISDYEWEIPKTGKMKVPGKVFASERLVKAIQEDKTLEQVKNVATLSGIIKASIAMPDAHQGYGFSIGGVAAFDIDKGIISPGGVGYDINCGVRLMKTNLTLKDIPSKEVKRRIINQLFRDVPSGVGEKGRIKVDDAQLNDVLLNGAQWAVKNGYGVDEDLKHTEDGGKIGGAMPEAVGQRARARGKPQLGSLGAGNHFLEVQSVESVFDKALAKRFGIEEGQITIMIHCGSRGLGHQVASDYIKEMERTYEKETSKLPDRELVNAPIKSDLGKRYFGAMAASANFAFANRQIIMHWVREAMKRLFPKFKGDLVYDVCHNIAKFEKHKIDGKEKEVLVMRKGATRSFNNQPVILPGSMGTSSYLLVGTEKAEEISWGSTAHGAGRVSSRTNARKNLNSEDIKKSLNSQGIEIVSGSNKGIVEEAPEVYKDIDEVAKVSNELGIGRIVARLKPLAVMKG